MLTLVTVVCERDFEVFELQLESIVKFVDNCIHWIIINDQNHASFKKWNNLIQQYRTKNYISKILTLENFTHKLDEHGWRRQQQLKLLVAQFIDDDYLILDAKNFFIRSSNEQDWKNTLGCGLVTDTKTLDNNFPSGNCIKNYSEYFLKFPLDKFLTPQTPFFIQKKYLLNIKNIQDALNVLVNQDKPCEFLFYSYLIPNNVLNQISNNEHRPVKYKTYWSNFWLNKNCNLLKEIMTVYTFNTDIKVLGLHNEFLALIDNQDNLNDINNFLNYIQLKFKFDMYIPTKMLNASIVWRLRKYKNQRKLC